MRVRRLAASSSIVAVVLGCASAPPPPNRGAQEKALVAAVERDPAACPSSTSPCPALTGDPWNGAVASPLNATNTAVLSTPSPPSSGTSTPRKAIYPETFCPDGTIADGNKGDLECHCCKPFGIPCPDSSVLAPRPEGHCIVFGSEDKSCLWKCD